jgi:hypothetical protein
MFGMRLCAWVVLLVLAPATAHAVATAPCRPSADIVTTRPAAGGPPVPVRVGFFVLDLAGIDELHESFTADFLMVVRWRDPRLATSATEPSFEDCLLGLDDVWHPRIGIVNQQHLVSRGDQTLRVDPEGNVEFRVGYYGSLSARLDLRRFPFDEQRLTISVSTDYPPREVELVGDAESTGVLSSADLAGWRIVRMDGAPMARPLEAASATYSVTEFAVWVEREAGYYLWKVFLPLSFIIGMASIVFWLDPRELGPQIGVSTATAFTLVAFLESLDRFLPRVSYLTTADTFVLGTIVLVFAALAECIVAGRLAKTGRYELAHRIDVVGRWAYLAAYLGLVSFLLAAR